MDAQKFEIAGKIRSRIDGLKRLEAHLNPHLFGTDYGDGEHRTQRYEGPLNLPLWLVRMCNNALRDRIEELQDEFDNL